MSSLTMARWLLLLLGALSLDPSSRDTHKHPSTALEIPPHGSETSRLSMNQGFRDSEAADITSINTFILVQGDNSAFLEMLTCFLKRYHRFASGDPLHIYCDGAAACERSHQLKLVGQQVHEATFADVSGASPRQGPRQGLEEHLQLSQTGSQTGVAWPPVALSHAHFPLLRQRLMSVAEGGLVLHSDVDIQLRSDFSVLKKIVEGYDADIVIEIAHGIPRDVKANWGFVLNTGFALYRKTPPTLALVEKLVEAVGFDAQDSDDQGFFNHVLINEDVTWSDEAFTGAALDAPVTLKVGRTAAGLRIVVLPEEIVARNAEFADKAVLAFHPYEGMEKKRKDICEETS